MDYVDLLQVKIDFLLGESKLLACKGDLTEFSNHNSSTIVLILDGSLECDAQVCSEIRNLTFSIVFTNGKRVDGITPPPRNQL